MVRAGVPGETVVRVHVGADGLVNKATVLKTTQPEFSPEAALNVVKHWRFLEHMDPWVTTKRGMIIDCRIVFTIDES
jgi:TonB family protein